ncbi:MAG: tRNA(fMet)-specific endonuclease VapC [Acidimicrobiales bacterium]|nr:tRNA(fMet)-specific endonuclease VapC [Acidimicrobiales bacterium]
MRRTCTCSSDPAPLVAVALDDICDGAERSGVEVDRMVCVSPASVAVIPGPRHWAAFEDLCRAVEARGNLVPDAYLAAVAIDHGAVWCSADRGFARFPGLRWEHPLDP